MEKIWWIFGAAAFTAIAYFIPGQAGYMWSSVIVVMVITGIYFLGLAVYFIRNAQSAKTDEIRQNLATLASESYEYLVLPQDLNGGGGSFEGFQIEDLPSYAELVVDNYTFGATSSDTLLRIIGTDKPDYPQDDPNGEEIKLIVQVLPSDIMKWEKQE